MQSSVGRMLIDDEDILEEAVSHYELVFKERVIEPD